MPDDNRIKNYGFFTDPPNTLVAIPKSYVHSSSSTETNPTELKLTDSHFQINGVSPQALRITSFTFFFGTVETAETYNTFGGGSPSAPGHHFTITNKDGHNNFTTMPLRTQGDIYTYFDEVTFQKDQLVSPNVLALIWARKNFGVPGVKFPSLNFPEDTLVISNSSIPLEVSKIEYRFEYVGYYNLDEITA